MKKLIIVIALASACFFANAQSKTLGQHFALSLDYRPGIHYQIGSQWLHSAYNVGLGIKYRW